MKLVTGSDERVTLSTTAVPAVCGHTGSHTVIRPHHDQAWEPDFNQWKELVELGACSASASDLRCSEAARCVDADLQVSRLQDYLVQSLNGPVGGAACMVLRTVMGDSGLHAQMQELTERHTIRLAAGLAEKLREWSEWSLGGSNRHQIIGTEQEQNQPSYLAYPSPYPDTSKGVQ